MELEFFSLRIPVFFLPRIYILSFFFFLFFFLHVTLDTRLLRKNRSHRGREIDTGVGLYYIPRDGIEKEYPANSYSVSKDRVDSRKRGGEFDEFDLPDRISLPALERLVERGTPA